jgi:hypothetical protein
MLHAVLRRSPTSRWRRFQEMTRRITRSFKAANCQVAALLGLVACSSKSNPPTATLLASADIGPGGGTVQSDGGVRVDVPPGAVGQVTTLTISQLSNEPAPADTAALSAAYVLGPEGATFDKTLQVTVPFDASRMPAGASSATGGVLLFRASSNGTDWVSMGGQVTNSTIMASTPGLSKWQAGWYSYDCSFSVPSGPISPGDACYLKDPALHGVDCDPRADAFSVPDVAVWAKSCSCTNGNPPAGPYQTWLCYAPHMAWIYKNYCGLSCAMANGADGGSDAGGCSSGCNPVGTWSVSAAAHLISGSGTCGSGQSSVQIASAGPSSLTYGYVAGGCDCGCNFPVSFDPASCSAAGTETVSCDGGTVSASLNLQFCGNSFTGTEQVSSGGLTCGATLNGSR